MKKISSILLITGGLLAANIQRPPVADIAAIADAKTVVAEPQGKKLKVNTAASKLGWVGTKPSGQHNGEIAIKKGNIATNGKTITGGNFTLDIAGITVLDLTGKGKEGLEGHLKSPDFFDAAKNPEAMFEVTSATAIEAGTTTTLAGATHNISGNLTLRGVTKNVTFPAKVEVSKKKVTAVADFNIDRTEWGMTYGADGKVNKEVNLKLNLVAGK